MAAARKSRFRFLHRAGLLPAPYASGEGDPLLYSLLTLLDIEVEGLRQAYDLRLPEETCSSGALAKLGSARSVLRAEHEDNATYAKRLREWRWPNGHRKRGTGYELARQLRAHLPDGDTSSVFAIRQNISGAFNQGMFIGILGNPAWISEFGGEQYRRKFTSFRPDASLNTPRAYWLWIVAPASWTFYETVDDIPYATVDEWGASSDIVTTPSISAQGVVNLRSVIEQFSPLDMVLQDIYLATSAAPRIWANEGDTSNSVDWQDPSNYSSGVSTI